MTDFDVVVVGAGPAGSVAALETARAGARVVLVDRSGFPRWKVCGACLSRGALRALRELGLGASLEALGGVPLETLSLEARGRSARLPLPGSLALSRAALDAAVARAAVREGVEFLSGSRAILGDVVGDRRRLGLVRGGVRTEVTAGVVVDATGLGRGLGGEPEVARASRVGLGAVFEAPAYPLARGELRMVVGRFGYVGLVRVEDGALNIGAALDPGVLRRSDPSEVVGSLLAEAGAAPLSGQVRHGWRGTPPLTRDAASPGAERLLRVGDAAGYVEPFTGEGIGWAIAAGRAVAALAAEGMRAWDPAILRAWGAYHARDVGRSQRLCRLLAGALRQPVLVGCALRALQVAPGVARPFVRAAARPPGPLMPGRA